MLVFSWRYRQVQGAYAYIWHVVGQCLWISGYIFELLSPQLGGKIFWDKFQYVAGLIILVAFPVFAVQYTDTILRRSKILFFASFLVPISFIILLLTDNQLHLLYPNPYLVYRDYFDELRYEFTWLVYVYAAYSYLVSLFGLTILIRRLIRPHRLYRSQILTIVLGFVLPLFFTILTTAGIDFKPFRDVSPFTFAAGNLIVSWGLFRYRLFAVIPIARDLIIDKMEDLVVVLDIQDRVVDINPNALAAINQKSHKTVGLPVETVFASWPDILEKFKNPENITTEITIRSDGEEIQYEVKSTLLNDNHDRYVGRAFVARDITEHMTLKSQLQNLNEDLENRVAKRTAELRKSEKKFRLVFEEANDAIFIIKDGVFVECNTKAIEMYGYPREEIIGKRPQDFSPEIQPNGKTSREAAKEKLGATLQTGESQFFEWRHLHNDNTFDVEVSLNLLELDTEKFVQAIVRNITERKQAEEIIKAQLEFEVLMTKILTSFAVSGYTEIEEKIQEALNEIASFMKVERAYIIIIDPEKKRSWRVTHEWCAPGIPPRIQERQNLPFGIFPWIESRLLDGKINRINSLEEFPEEAVVDRDLQKAEDTKSLLHVPIRESDGPISGGIGVNTYTYQKTWSDDDVSRLKMFGDAVANLLKRKFAEESLITAYDTTLEGWARALELKDKETEDHSRRVTDLTVLLAQTLGIQGDALTYIRRGAILHDIGKMGIPDSVLQKPGKLTKKEFEIIKQHPNHSMELLSNIPFLAQATDIPYCHHEYWDGSGYPRGLKGEEIPLAARIFSVVDVWDAVQSERPYNHAWSKEKTISYLKVQSGKQFDPNIVTVFLKLVEKGGI